MKLHFLGAARTVTGSCAMIEACGKRFWVDCGLHQGNHAIEARNRRTRDYSPEKVDFALLTHAHMDHSGLLPAMAANGFRGQAYCTKPTADLLGVMLEDSARIQESEAELAARKFRRQGKRNPPPPLYTVEDAAKACQLVKGVDYHKTFSPAPGIRATYYDAGHILGSGTLRLEIEEDGKTTSLIFSGDIGRPNALIVRDPEQPPRADYIFMESTYGDRDHKAASDSHAELAEAIAWSHSHGEKTIIPAFAVERTQEILYTLYELSKDGKIPLDMAIFVDSPLAIKASEIFTRHGDVFDSKAKALFRDKEAARFMKRVNYTLKPEESQWINSYTGPAIVIAASGMCNAGRVRHHLKHNLWRAGASIVFVGFQAMGTPGRKLVEKAKKISVFGEDVQVAAKIFTINGFSAHAGQSQLLDWLEPLAQGDKKPEIILLHGEYSAQKILAGLIERQYGIKARMPDYLDEMRITGKDSAISANTREAPQWDAIMEKLENKLGELKSQVAGLREKSWEEQKEAEEEFNNLHLAMSRLLEKK